ncbi:MAG: hypothetical protein EOO03_01640 [Chitinophagaceae bacterium]|nr:MAG: hypothetical protein EOO03_01640 [Chitinophagaceae bacterium]
MKQLMALLVTASLFMTACEKGGDGAQGPMGNADVTVYNYPTQTTSSGSLNYTLTISKEKLDSSLVLVYYNPSTETSSAWYPVPGIGPTANYETRYFIYQTATTPNSQYTLAVRLTQPANALVYTGTTTFTKLKIVIAPASQVLAGGRMAAPYDVNDYYSVKNYFGLED